MKKVKVRIYKDPYGKGGFINPTKKFLQKAATGMQVGQDMMSIEDIIVDELKNNTSAEDIADMLETEYGVRYYEGLNMIDDVINYVYDDYANDIKNAELSDSELIPDEEEPEPVKKPPLYSIDEPWISEEGDDEDWDDFGEDSGEEDEEDTEEEEEDLSSNKSKQPKSTEQQTQSSFDQLVNRQPDTGGGVDINKLFPNKLEQWMQYATPENKKGGNVNKGKFVKNIVRGLHKAAEGVEQQANESSILDTPLNGRETHINNFRRGIKNLGNEFYAKQIYDQTKELNNQVRSLPPMAQDGMEVGVQDNENMSHHLEKYANTVGNIFKQPMNQIHGAGYEQIPQARKGREQRQAERQQRNMGKDFRRMFGDMAVGYAGVPGMPNYIQMITPQIQTGQGAPQGYSNENTQANTGPFVDVEYKKGPWWTGRREWSAKGIPAEMMMGMIGGGGGSYMPGRSYGPGRTTSSSSWSKSWSSPGEIIRETVKNVNSKADPAKSNTTTLNNNSISDDQRKKYQEYVDDYNNETVTDPIGAGMSRQAPISIEEFIAKDADGLSEYDWWLKRSPGTTTSSKQLNPNSSYSKTSSVGGAPLQNEQVIDYEAWKYSGAKNPFTTRIVREWNEDFGKNIKKSGAKDNPNTSSDESQVWSSPVDQNKYNELMHLYNNIGEQALTPEQLNLIEQDSYITTDDQGNEYSSKNVYLPNPDFKAKFELSNAMQDIYGPADWDWLYKNEKLFKKEHGGFVDTANMDPNTLTKFIYGGDEDIPISPIVAYDNNDIQTKNVDDPFMFRRGGLYKFQGTQDSETNPYNLTNPTSNGQTTNTVNQYQTPAFNRYNPNATSASNFSAFTEMKRRGLVQGNYDPTKSYDMNTSQNQTQNQNQNQNQNQTQNQGNYGYPTAPSPMRQIFDMFNPIKKDFTWLSQRDYPRTADGQIYNPQGQGQTQGQGQGTTTQNQTQGAGGKPQPGYMYDYKYEKGPWWSGKKTLTVSGKWVDPNNPNAGAAQPGSGNTQNNTTTTNNNATTTNNNTNANNTNANNNATPSNWHAPMVLPGTETQTANTATEENKAKSSSIQPQVPNVNAGTPGQGANVIQNIASGNNLNYQDTRNMIGSNPLQAKSQPGQPGSSQQGANYIQGVASGNNLDYNTSRNTVGSSPLDAQNKMPNAPMKDISPGANAQRNFMSELERLQNVQKMQGVIDQVPGGVFPGFAYGGYMPEYMAYGGYMPAYQGGGANAGTGPFDPNVSGIAGGGIGPCTEQQVLNAAPGDPCYNEGYSKGLPKDFSVQYDINTAKTLDLKAASNLKNLAGFGLRANAGRKEMNYNQDYLADNTTSDNREAANELDYTGGYSGLNQRIMSKSGAGATGFNRVVGEAAFVKKGGELKYQRGGVYDLTQEEIGQILASGGQIKFL